MNGWRVLNRLKNHLSTRHIPVCVISTDEARAQALEAGAAGFIAKPLQSKETLDGRSASCIVSSPGRSATC
jgi:CheY-like chemotaxis protein